MLLTVLNENETSVNWEESDTVGIYDGKAVRKFTVHPNETDPTTATLKGEAIAADEYIAFYPYSESLVIDGSSITFPIPETQTATAGSFGSGTNPSWARTSEGSMTLQFSNLATLVKFTVDADFGSDISELKLFSNGDEALSGSMTYNIVDGSLTAQEGASSSVTLTGPFGSGNTYYFVVAPGTLAKGVNIRYTTADGETCAKYFNNEQTFEAGKIMNLGTLSESDLVPVITYMDFINAVKKALPDIGWTENSDGTVSLTEDNKSVIEGVNELKIYGPVYNEEYSLTDLSDIKYFTGLESLTCGGHPELESLDVSALKNLTSLDCSNNESLSELNLEGLTALKKLQCGSGKLSALDLSGQSALTYLACTDNPLEGTLDLHHMKGLTTLYCNNTEITSLNVSGLTSLGYIECYETEISSLDVSGLSGLTYLDCSDNKNLTELIFGENTNLKKLNCYNCSITSLDVSSLKNLTSLGCHSNRMESLDITNNTKLGWVSCGNQTSDGTTLQDLVLTLTATQETKWKNNWSMDPDAKNEKVNINVGSIDASHEGFEDGGSIS